MHINETSASATPKASSSCAFLVQNTVIIAQKTFNINTEDHAHK